MKTYTVKVAYVPDEENIVEVLDMKNRIVELLDAHGFMERETDIEGNHIVVIHTITLQAIERVIRHLSVKEVSISFEARTLRLLPGLPAIAALVPHLEIVGEEPFGTWLALFFGNLMAVIQERGK